MAKTKAKEALFSGGSSFTLSLLGNLFGEATLEPQALVHRIHEMAPNSNFKTSCEKCFEGIEDSSLQTRNTPHRLPVQREILDQATL